MISLEELHFFFLQKLHLKISTKSQYQCNVVKLMLISKMHLMS